MKIRQNALQKQGHQTKISSSAHVGLAQIFIFLLVRLLSWLMIFFFLNKKHSTAALSSNLTTLQSQRQPNSFHNLAFLHFSIRHNFFYRYNNCVPQSCHFLPFQKLHAHHFTPELSATFKTVLI